MGNSLEFQGLSVKVSPVTARSSYTKSWSRICDISQRHSNSLNACNSNFLFSFSVKDSVPVLGDRVLQVT